MSFQPSRRIPLAAGLLLCLCGASPRPDDLGAVGDFALTERSGRTVTKSDLHGKIWIASFEFTRCTAGCPQVSDTMRRLQGELKRFPDIRLVTFTVDPEHDHPEELREYANRYQADPDRWLFLTGEEATIYRLLHDSFHLPTKKNAVSDPGNAVDHSLKLVLVDRQGHIRGYFDGRRDTHVSEDEFEANLDKLKQSVKSLEYDPFPLYNAILNSIATVFLLLGYAAIRQRLVRLHVLCMVTALCLSVIFLVSYLYDHTFVKQGTTPFALQTSHAHPPPWVGIVYQIVLWTHTPLAAVIAPLALYTAYLALRRRYVRHRAVARWALPMWIYVTVTGVVVYWMLYQLYPWP